MVGDSQPDTWVLRMEVPQPFRQVDVQRRLGCADTDCTMLKGRAGAQLLLGILYLHSSRGNAGIEHLPLRRQRHTPALASLGIPCLLLTNNAAGLGIENLSSVSVDDRAAAAVMIEQLYAKGHRVIGIIGDRPETSRPSQQRLDGCLDALQRLGVPFDFDRQYRLADFSMQGGYAAAEHLLAHCPDLDAVFAMSDLMALGAVRAFQDHGLRVPQDIGVAGYDGISLGRFTVPRLTTIRQNTTVLAERAADILLRCIEENAPARHETVPFELVEGESV